MPFFTENEQWDNDYNIFLIDNQNRIALLCHDGFRLLPPTIVKSKENLEKVDNYFNLHKKIGSYRTCPDLKDHLDIKTISSYEKYLSYFGEFSSKGIYTYDTYDFSYTNRPYFRVTIPENKLILSDLPEDIISILEPLRLDELSFENTSIIDEKIVSEL